MIVFCLIFQFLIKNFIIIFTNKFLHIILFTHLEQVYFQVTKKILHQEFLFYAKEYKILQPLLLMINVFYKYS